jgi:SAM-dependent methyltransferase
MRSRAGLVVTLLRQGFDPAQILVRLAARRALLGCDSVLDVGCGTSLTMRQLGVPVSAGIEAYQPSFDDAKRRHTHDRLIHGDIRNLTTYFQQRQFDACVALDVIEHLDKRDGLKLIREMEGIARRKVVFFTPSGFLPQRHCAADDLQEHLSGWEPDEMRRFGYHVIGLLGPKGLRGESHVLKRRPAIFWGLASLLSHLAWTRWQPERAAAILCVKDITGVGPGSGAPATGSD